MKAEELEKWLAGMKAKANAAAKAGVAKAEEAGRKAKSLSGKLYRARIKADPARYEEFKAARKDMHRRWWERVKADPVRHEEFNAKRRKRRPPRQGRAEAAPKAATWAEEKARAEHAAFLEERAAYWRSYRAVQRMLAHIFKEEE